MEEKNTNVVQNNEPVVLNVEPPKKKKKGKKVFLLLFIILLIAAGLCTWFALNNSDKDDKDNKQTKEETKKEKKEEKKKEEKKKEPKEEKKEPSETILYFYYDGSAIKMTKNYDDIADKTNIISKYMCEANCNEIATENFNPGIMINKKVFIDDNSKMVLFDIEEGKVVGEYGLAAFWLHDEDSKYTSDGGRYIMIKALDSDYYGIIDKNGGIIHEFNIGTQKRGGLNNKYPMYTTYYSVEGDYIVNYKDDKFGITKITSNDVVVDYKYDDIKLMGRNYYKVSENNKWYLYSFATKTKVLNDGYDYIIGVYDNIVIVDNDKKIYIKDFSGNNLIDSPIDDTSKDIKDIAEVCCGNNPGVTSSLEKNVITISVYKEGSNDATYYNYDIATKTLAS